MLTLIKHIRVSCRTSVFGEAIILISLKHVLRRTAKREDAEYDEDEVNKEPEETESLWDTIVTGLSSVLPFTSESYKEEASIP